MTDANLMDADCVHGQVWYECSQCQADQPKPLTYSQAEALMRKKWYVWEMARFKDRIRPETKRRLKTEFEDSVLELAACIEHGRQQALQMEEYHVNVQ